MKVYEVYYKITGKRTKYPTYRHTIFYTTSSNKAIKEFYKTYRNYNQWTYKIICVNEVK